MNQQPIRHPWPKVVGVPSTLVDKMGRIKTIRQMHLDNNRTNEFVPPSTHERETNSFKAPR
jgi:hypothetical protein